MRRFSRLVPGPLAVLAILETAGCSSSPAAVTSGASDGGRDDGGLASTVPSCASGAVGAAACGLGSAASCCAAAVVPGGTFYRSYDGVSTNGASKAFAATVSSFALDQFEVTVGRFRAFVQASTSGWTPQAGSGKHAHLAAGGLTDTNGAVETGWDASWTTKLPTTSAGWGTTLACDPTYATWTPAATATDDHPINCVDWYEAYAFCIWDGGFLPSEAEWNYTAAGGAEQRLYPWSLPYPPGSTTLDCAHADYAASWPSTSCVPTGTSKVGAFSPAGDGKWGHADLAGNVFEWTLDSFAASYATTCSDCADLASVNDQVIRGGSFDGSPACLLNSLREDSVPTGHSASIGFRCARRPR
jgi:formylglycine-generating enzyme required for sulfatase activity